MPMTHSMSPWTLVAEASLLVQLVMLVLAIASLASWFLIVQRGTLLARARKSLDRFEDDFRDMRSRRSDLGQLCPPAGGEGREAGGAARVLQAGWEEFFELNDNPTAEPEVVLEGAQRAMRVAISREEDRLGQHLTFLATVGSVSPYVGLFGTVWGIMNSFIGLAEVQQATLAAVAPGIAEALIATAIGLFAAIPAVIAYNRFSAAREQLISRYYTFAEELSVVLHRRLHGRVDAAEGG